jgi:hypothetical protein
MGSNMVTVFASSRWQSILSVLKDFYVKYWYNLHIRNDHGQELFANPVKKDICQNFTIIGNLA